MPRNGSGQYTLPAGNPVVSGQTISSSVQNSTMNDVASALSASIANDGQTQILANLPMNGFKHTGAANGSLSGDYTTIGQLGATTGAGLVGYAATTYPTPTVGSVLTGVTPASLLVVGNGPWANPAISDTQHLLEIVNDNGPNQCFAMSAYGVSTNGNNMHWNRYNGTIAAPTAVTSGEYFKSEGYRGWDGSGTLSQSMAAHQVLTTENWTPTAHGIKFHWELTKTGSASRLPAMDLYASVADSVILGLGDGSALFSRIINQSAIGALQLHGDNTQAGAQLLLYSRSHATAASQSWERFRTKSFQDLNGTEILRIEDTTQRILSPGVGGIGYATGAGSSQSQSTAKTDGITANVASCKIAMNGASLAANTAVSFTFTNSQIAVDDNVIVTIRANATAGAYAVAADQISAGSCRISLRNLTAGALAEAVVLQVSIIKGASS